MSSFCRLQDTYALQIEASAVVCSQCLHFAGYKTHVHALQIEASAVVCSQCLHFAGYKKCVLVGHDWGGIVAWSFAQTSPEMVERFIVMNCPSSAAYIKQASSGFSQIRKSW